MAVSIIAFAVSSAQAAVIVQITPLLQTPGDFVLTYTYSPQSFPEPNSKWPGRQGFSSRKRLALIPSRNMSKYHRNDAQLAYDRVVRKSP
jgi:hypothetical protein